MRRMIILAGILPMLAVAAASAHDEFRIVGTIAKQSASSLDVKTKDGKTVSIALNEQTFVNRDKQKVAVSEIKTGGTVVVDALGDSLADLVALEVRLVPPITAAPK